jgi:hypothetical protein
MRLPIEGYSTSRKKAPPPECLAAGLGRSCQSREVPRCWRGAIGSNSIPKTFSHRVPAAVTLRNVVSKPAVPLGCSPGNDSRHTPKLT